MASRAKEQPTAEVSAGNAFFRAVSRLWRQPDKQGSLQWLHVLLAYGVLGMLWHWLSAPLSPVPVPAPHAGVALAAMLQFGPRIWPALFVAAWGLAFLVHGDFLQGLLQGLAVALQFSLAAVVLKHVFDFDVALRKTRDVLAFLLLGVIGSALLGVLLTSLASGLLKGAAGTGSAAWQAALFADLAGMLVFAPLFLIWAHASSLRWAGLAVFFALIYWGLLQLGGTGASVPSFPSDVSYPLQIALFSILIAVALRLGRKVLTATVLFLAVGLLAAVALNGGGNEAAPVLKEAMGLPLLAIPALALLVTSLVTERSSVRSESGQKSPHGNPISLQGADFSPALTLDDVGCIILALDEAGRVTHVNRRARQVLGYEAGALLGRDWFETAVPVEQRSLARKRFQRLMKQGLVPAERFEQDLLIKGGRQLSVSWHLALQPGAGGRPQGCLLSGEDITSRRRLEESLLHHACHDPLTRLPNRGLALEQLKKAMAAALRNDGQVSVLYFDLDHFKQINDSLGHPVGDEALVEAARRVKACIRESDILARLGGDEFLIILPSVTGAHECESVAEKIIKAFAAPFCIAGHELAVTTSVGISLFPDDGKTVEALVRNADTAMYQAKKQGRNAFHFYTRAMDQSVKRRLEVETHLRRALNNGELRIHFQPQVDLSRSRITAAEALLRWQSPLFGVLSPPAFLDLAEDTGLINALGEWVLQTACLQARQWREVQELSLTVNMSYKQVLADNFVEIVELALAESKLPPNALTLDITEKVVLAESDELLQKLCRLHDLGVQIALDDFGSGFSSLSHLQRAPLDVLKIDRTHVQNISRNVADAAMCDAIIGVGHRLGYQVFAKGVETVGQLGFLRLHGVDSVQGDYLGRPLPGDEFRQIIESSLAREKLKARLQRVLH